MGNRVVNEKDVKRLGCRKKYEHIRRKEHLTTLRLWLVVRVESGFISPSSSTSKFNSSPLALFF